MSPLLERVARGKTSAEKNDHRLLEGRDPVCFV